MANTTDLRILRTKKNIYDAFLSLLQEKSFDQITVRDITERAFINRNTFYLHYRDKADLLKSISSERLNNIHQLLTQPYEQIDENYFRSVMLRLIQEIFDNKVFYRAMMKDNSSDYFREQIKKEIVEQMLANVHITEPNDQTLFCIEYAVSGFIGAISFCLGMQNEPPIEEIADLTFRAVFDSFLDLWNKHLHVDI